MGNNSSSWFSSKTEEEIEAENKKLRDSLTKYDITMSTIKHENMFKGTIIICIIYAILGFILVLLSYLSESVKDLLFNKFLYFTIIYIIGSIIIILIMLYNIYYFKPSKITRYNNIDDISCPDYWNVEIIDDKYIGDSFDSNYAEEFKYRCVLNEDIFNKKDMFKYHNNSNYRAANINSNIFNFDDFKIGKYNSRSNSSFDEDKFRSNIYVDINNFSTNNSSDITSFNTNKKYL